MNVTVATKTRLATPEISWGKEARLGQCNDISISNGIIAEWREAIFPEDDQPEQQGRIVVDMAAGDLPSIQLSLPVFTGDDDNDAAIFTFSFLPAFFSTLPPDALNEIRNSAPDNGDVRRFSFAQETVAMLEQLRNEALADTFVAALQRMQLASAILIAALNSITLLVTEEEVPACRFLAYDSEREKIADACNWIQKSEGRPYTIRELSRKVAMNECYLKKGFKALTGKTIHEYQQDIRIGKAKEMLKTQGVTVTDVALTLGYSSISHFSTAFKRVTGLKPCELLS